LRATSPGRDCASRKALSADGILAALASEAGIASNNPAANAPIQLPEYGASER
jgi:hypothetical protein